MTYVIITILSDIALVVIVSLLFLGIYFLRNKKQKKIRFIKQTFKPWIALLTFCVAALLAMQMFHYLVTGSNNFSGPIPFIPYPY